VRSWLTVALLLGALAAPSKAVSPGWQVIDADVLIEGCRQVAREGLESGVTSRLRAAATDATACLAEEIVRQAREFLAPHAMSEAEVRAALAQISAAYGRLYWVMYNEHKACDQGCGTLYHTIPLAALAALHEGILRDLIAQRNEYRE
jgi:hypothetical protein